MNHSPVKTITNMTIYHSPPDLMDIFIDLYKTRREGLGELRVHYVKNPMTNERTIELIFHRLGQSPVLIASKEISEIKWRDLTSLKEKDKHIFKAIFANCYHIDKTDWIGLIGVDFLVPYYLVVFKMNSWEEALNGLSTHKVNVWNKGGRIECFTLSPETKKIYRGDLVMLNKNGTIEKLTGINQYYLCGTAMHDAREGELLSIDMHDINDLQFKRANPPGSKITKNEINTLYEIFNKEEPKKPKGVVIQSIDLIREKLRRDA